MSENVTIKVTPCPTQPDSMVQWQDCRPECWEAWGPEFNLRPGLDQTQWYSGKISIVTVFKWYSSGLRARLVKQ